MPVIYTFGRRIAFFLICWSILTYFSEDKMTADCYTHLLIPEIMLSDADITFNKWVPPSGKLPYWLIRSSRFPDQIVSMYPPATGLIFSPFYYVYNYFEETVQRIPRIIGLKVAVLWMALAGLFFLMAIEQAGISSGRSILYGILFVFGTACWSTGAGGLWQHTAGLLMLTLFLWVFFCGFRSKKYFVLSGIPLSLAAACRPTNGIFIVAVVMFLFIRERKYLGPFLCAILPVTILAIGYNLHYFGQPFIGGYSGDKGGFTYPFWGGFLGLFFSPSKGIFPITPFWIFSPFLFIKGCRHNRPFKENAITAFLMASLFVILIYSKWYFWWGGLSYGYRIISDISPFMTLSAIWYIEKHVSKVKIARTIFVILSVMSITNQMVFYTSSGYYPWHAKYDRENAFDADHYREHPFPPLLWSFSNSQVLFHYKDTIRALGVWGLMDHRFFRRGALDVEVFRDNMLVVKGYDKQINHELKDYMIPGLLRARWSGYLLPDINPVKFRLTSNDKIQLQIGLQKWPVGQRWEEKEIVTPDIAFNNRPESLDVLMVDRGGPAFIKFEYWNGNYWSVIPESFFYYRDSGVVSPVAGKDE
ncbi:hypothetical protein JW979_00475 [bacterium]|nr:hypothetical protein [candidate division CSSED10-310 bacterium]